VQINISISYHNAFQPGSPPIILTNLAYERVSLLFNLAALLSQLADGEDRSTPEGIKRATAYYQVLHFYFSFYLHILTTRARTPPAR
jgi:programmed cell death 6-interacting protein